jgi:hypothetical protein
MKVEGCYNWFVTECQAKDNYGRVLIHAHILAISSLGEFDVESTPDLSRIIEKIKKNINICGKLLVMVALISCYNNARIKYGSINQVEKPPKSALGWIIDSEDYLNPDRRGMSSCKTPKSVYSKKIILRSPRK